MKEDVVRDAGTVSFVVQYILVGKRKTICLIPLGENRVFRGVAKCNPCDEYDEDVGRSLSFYRAFKKFSKAAIRHIREGKTQSGLKRK